ncbi:MAG: hypothetical protein R3A51_00755 [Nannocystaceae bacterium]|nr:hypothetical protein [Myxococcales bacterium]
MVILVAGCRAPGLEPLPPERDAGNPDAPASAWQPGPDPTERSAFEGVALDEGGHAGHGHHHHGGHGAAERDATKPAADATTTDEHAGHGAPKGGQ